MSRPETGLAGGALPASCYPIIHRRVLPGFSCCENNLQCACDRRSTANRTRFPFQSGKACPPTLL